MFDLMSRESYRKNAVGFKLQGSIETILSLADILKVFNRGGEEIIPLCMRIFYRKTVSEGGKSVM